MCANFWSVSIVYTNVYIVQCVQYTRYAYTISCEWVSTYKVNLLYFNPGPPQCNKQVRSWKQKLPLNTVLRLLQVLVPQVEKLCNEK